LAQFLPPTAKTSSPKQVMKKINTLIFLLVSVCSVAQNSATITLTTPKNEPVIATLIREDVRFSPNLGIGLAESSLEPVAIVNFKETTSDKSVIDLTEPKMLRLRYSGHGANKTWMMFIQPGDNITASFPGNGDVVFSGKNAFYQDFLKTYFLENQYQYLPVFGYKPSQIDNKSVVQQSDSLQKLRIAGYQTFKSAHTPVAPFDAYVTATTATEPSLMRQMIQEKIMRRNRVTKLTPDQRHEIEDLTLTDFKILSDDALLSQAYRDELRSWALIPSTRKFPVKEENRYEISPEALRDVYAFSKEKLQNFPKQKEYLLTYWLNYSATAIPTLETAKTLFEDYKTIYPKSANTEYFSKLISTKESLTSGRVAADVPLLTKDSTAVSISQMKGKPVVMVFAFGLGQHEPGLKAIEDKYGSKVIFTYVSVTNDIPFETWKKHVTDRPNVKHLWASDESIVMLKEKYAIDIRYPYMVTDASGRIVNRWIPQEFPNNRALDSDIQKAIEK
jgi:hypothetical protein